MRIKLAKHLYRSYLSTLACELRSVNKVALGGKHLAHMRICTRKRVQGKTVRQRPIKWINLTTRFNILVHSMYKNISASEE